METAGYTRDLNRAEAGKLAAHLDYRIDWDRPAELQLQAKGLLDRYSLEATKFTLGKVRDFATNNQKKPLIILFDPRGAMVEMREKGTRYDQPIGEALNQVVLLQNEQS